MEDAFAVRHYAPEQDVSALSRLLTDIESVDRDGEETSEEYLRSMMTWPNFDPGRNAWVAERDGVLTGYGQTHPMGDGNCSIYVGVHPAHRRKGLGNRLLELVTSRSQEAGSKAMLAYANGENTASNRFLEHRGFTVAGTSGVMAAPVTDLPEADIPSGYSLRRYPEVGDAQLIARALNECYRDMVGHHQNVTSADRYLDYYGSEGLHFLFDEQGALIGVCAGKPHARTNGDSVSDLLDAPGVVKEYRHRGWQRFLTLAVMSWLRGQGTHPITLEYWGDDERAIAIYRELGFAMVHQQMTYRKELQ